MDDASLDEFLPGDDGDEPDEADTGADPEPETVTDEDESSTEAAGVEPAASTYAWTGDGATCAACGASVTRRWRDGEDLVCADCKEW